ncbi:(R)-mandelonitrile beta-glucosyltransferase-like [Cryptomeria japonica]|uniref:(R)-mandelonitrile beta-glucosyltransferase-like n=1 Tax=Cryptomeria japonica TaxID=3369 RepID=UPI0027DA0A09|nr:(R)-mandelonitrile beta-glucosyltransferase-like [Cryptomeria japonica]
MCTASSIAQCNANLLISRGHIPVKVEHSNKVDKLITCLLKIIDVVNMHATLALILELHKADYVLVNTLDGVDTPQTVGALSSNGCPSLTVGPVFLPNFLEGRDLNGLGSMSEQEESCLKWLDAEEPGSVIYVFFSSIAIKSIEQLEELTVGLEKSQHPFLWVLRMDIAGGKPATLPEGFVERTVDRGLIVKWAPQV